VPRFYRSDSGRARAAAALDRLLDPENDAVTLSTLEKAAAAAGRQVRLEVV
jgi:hypothetical protein